jgi:hypothetical protein
MSRRRPSLVSLQPGVVWPGLVTRQQVFLAGKTAIAAGLEAYTAWVASADTLADRRPLAKAVHAADDTLSSALARVQQRWGNDPAQWLTFGMTLAMSQRILAEVGRPLDSAEREPAGPMD